MKITLNRPSIIKEAEGSRCILKKVNGPLSIIPECILFFIVLILTSIVYGLGGDFIAGLLYGITHGGGTVDDAYNWVYYTPISLMSEALWTLSVLLVAYIWQKRTPRTHGFVKKNAVRDYAIGLVAGFAMFSAAVGICVATGALSLKAASNVNYSLIGIFAIGWFFQGMAEEVMCRGFFLVSLARKNNLVVAVLGNSLAFAALHLANPGIGALPLVNLTLFGICASVFFIKTGNIWLVSAMHSIWNAVQGNFYGILVSGGFTGPTIFNSTIDTGKTLINGGDFGLEGGLAVSIVLVITIIIGLLIPGVDDKKAE